MVFQKVFLETLILKKKSADDKKECWITQHAKSFNYFQAGINMNSERCDGIQANNKGVKGCEKLNLLKPSV